MSLTRMVQLKCAPRKTTAEAESKALVPLRGAAATKSEAKATEPARDVKGARHARGDARRPFNGNVKTSVRNIFLELLRPGGGICNESCAGPSNRLR
jgi:hypothetical protein